MPTLRTGRLVLLALSALVASTLGASSPALAQAKEISNAEMGKVTSGLNLPGM